MRLSDFKDEAAIEVVANLLEPISKIAANPENAKAKDGPNILFAKALLKNNAKEVKEIFAILDGKDPADYHCSAATVIMDVLNMLNDHALVELFGLQRQTQPSSGSASETTEGQSE